MLAHALAYAERGWSVLPLWWPREDGACACGKATCKVGKHPLGTLVPNGLKHATTDAATIRDWWRRFPLANIGIATGSTSGIVVLDVDPQKDGDASLADLEAIHGPLPQTVTSRTGGGGQHLVFAHPGTPVPNRVALSPGLDVRGDGGYIVAPPSLHTSGRRYEWIDEPESAPVIAPVPKWLLAQANPNGHDAGARFDTAAALAGVAEGQRDETLFRFASKLRRAEGEPRGSTEDSQTC